VAACRVNDIPEASIEDRDEPRLHREVCSSRMTLKQAQHPAGDVGPPE
jgi:hypothetical protein